MEIEEIKKAVIRKGDILVLRYHKALSTEAKINIQKSCNVVLEKAGLKDNVSILVLEQGLEIEAVLTQNRDDCGQKEAKKIGLPPSDPDLSDFQRRG